ncbi:MAG: hypothetical protein JWP12_3225 [Bacteroidetes bacterium]|nr:hypothetical protein [Bacteroidota bacterium]
MTSDDENTRWRASVAIERIALDIWKKQYPGNEKLALEKMKLWQDEIKLDYKAGITEREKSIMELKNWLKDLKTP